MEWTLRLCSHTRHTPLVYTHIHNIDRQTSVVGGFTPECNVMQERNPIRRVNPNYIQLRARQYKEVHLSYWSVAPPPPPLNFGFTKFHTCTTKADTQIHGTFIPGTDLGSARIDKQRLCPSWWVVEVQLGCRNTHASIRGEIGSK